MISGLMAGAGTLARPALATPHTQSLTLRQLVDASDLVADVVPEVLDSTWVEVFGARRVVTFWRLHIVQLIAGRAEVETELVTLGGTVGDVLQWVPHEAALRSGARHLVFLRQGPLTRRWVTGMRQGAFALDNSNSQWRVSIAPQQQEFIEASGSAVGRLAGLDIASAERAIKAEWES